MRPSAAHNWGLTAHMELQGVKYHGERAGCTLHAPFGAASPDLGPQHLMATAFFLRGLDAEVEPLAAASTANAKLHARTRPGGVAANELEYLEHAGRDKCGWLRANRLLGGPRAS